MLKMTIAEVLMSRIFLQKSVKKIQVTATNVTLLQQQSDTPGYPP